MYALLEGASISLELARDNLDGALHHQAGIGPMIALLDSVPGGAGLVLSIGRNFRSVIDAATERLNRRECDPATSCYACLRTYRNQRFHHELSRGAALEVLKAMHP